MIPELVERLAHVDAARRLGIDPAIAPGDLDVCYAHAEAAAELGVDLTTRPEALTITHARREAAR